MNKNEQIGSRIKMSREREGLTQKELGEAVGRTESTIRKYEKGLIEVPRSVIERIALTLHTDLAFLMGIKVDAKNIINELNDLLSATAKRRYELENSLEKLDDYRIGEEQRKEILDNILPLLENQEHKKIKDELLKRFYMLNKKGKEKAIENVDLLTKVPEYRNPKEGE